VASTLRPTTLWLLLLALIVLSLPWRPVAAARTASDLLPSEQVILQKVARGEVADLQAAFGPEEGRRQVRAEFLARLLTGGYPRLNIPYPGVRLSRAIITGTLDLENAEIEPWVELVDCQFQGEVLLRDSWFKRGLTLSQSRFAQKVEMQRLRVGLSANFSEAIFSGPLDLWRAQIGGVWLANGLRCEDRQAGASMHAMTVNQAVFLNQAVFFGPVDLAGIRIGDGAQCSGASFGGALNMFGAQIGSQLNLTQARFAGPADFGYVSVGSQFIADGAHFANAAALANFNGLRVHHSAFLRQVHFAGPVNFVSAAIGSELQLDGSSFGEQTVDLNGLKVAQHCLLRKTVFQGPVSFLGAAIGGDLAFLQTEFRATGQPVNCNDIQVGATAYFWDSQWAGGLDLSGAQLHKVLIGTSAAGFGTIATLTLQNSVVARTLRLENVAIGYLEARKLTVKDGAELVAVKIQEHADLRGSVFGSVSFRETQWPPKPDAIWLEGLTYQSIGTGGEQDDWQALLAWVAQSRYDTRNYGQLENFCKQGGYKDRADEVYIQGRRREILQQWWRPDNLTVLIFWDLLTGYGRKPGRTLWIGGLIVLCGMVVFQEKNFDPACIGNWQWLRDGGRGRVWVFRFFLSLDQFLPGIDLGLAKLWNLSQVSYGQLVYYHFHKLAGWILIPIGLAALYSQFK